MSLIPLLCSSMDLTSGTKGVNRGVFIEESEQPSFVFSAPTRRGYSFIPAHLSIKTTTYLVRC